MINRNKIKEIAKKKKNIDNNDTFKKFGYIYIYIYIYIYNILFLLI